MQLHLLLLASLLMHELVFAACGAVFIEGEPVTVVRPEVSEAGGGTWQVLNDRLSLATSGTWSATDTVIEVGTLPIGWYRIEFYDSAAQGAGFTTAAVLAPLKSAPPEDTPVALDIALSWVPEENVIAWETCAQLARYASVRMVRDRLRWRDIQPDPGPFLQTTKYDRTAAIQQEQGLQILQVFHQTPHWVWQQDADRGRIPADLRDTWRFCKDIADRFKGRVQAWQPWNEGNSNNFGGHTIDELCSHQKAAFLGFRAGNPDAVVSWGPLGGINSEGLCKGILDNGAPDYFDVYAMHSYDWAHDYPRLRQWAVKAASGKPLWVTECDRGISADPDSPHGDLTHEDETRKAEFIVQSITSSLAAGASRHFHFILPQYMEQNNKIQFGLLRHDLTPRMGYVALAAAGRFLAGAQYLGRFADAEQPDLYAFVFRAQPDGVTRDLMIAWAEAPVDWPERGKTRGELSLPDTLPVESVWDYLGRPISRDEINPLTGAPKFLILPEGASRELQLQPPVSVPSTPQSSPSPVVLQLRAPEVAIRGRVRDWAHEHDHMLPPGNHELTVNAYNFGEQEASGLIKITDLPPGWRCEPDSWEVSLEFMGRWEQPVRISVSEPGPPPDEGAWIRLEGDFGIAGNVALAFRAMP